MLARHYLGHLRKNLVQSCSDKFKDHRDSFWVLFCVFGSTAAQLNSINSILSSLFALFPFLINYPRNTWASADHRKSHLHLYSISSPIVIRPSRKFHSTIHSYYISIHNNVFYPPTKSVLGLHWHCETYVFSYVHYSLIWECDNSESPI